MKTKKTQLLLIYILLKFRHLANLSPACVTWRVAARGRPSQLPTPEHASARSCRCGHRRRTRRLPSPARPSVRTCPCGNCRRAPPQLPPQARGPLPARASAANAAVAPFTAPTPARVALCSLVDKLGPDEEEGCQRQLIVSLTTGRRRRHYDLADNRRAARQRSHRRAGGARCDGACRRVAHGCQRDATDIAPHLNQAPVGDGSQLGGGGGDWELAAAARRLRCLCISGENSKN